MSKIKMLSDAYASLITSLGIEIREDDSLLQTVGGVNKVVMVEDKPLFLPNEQNTSNYNHNTVLFHPLSENVLLGESPVLKELRALVMERLHDVILNTVEAMLNIGVDNDLVSTLTPNQIEVLRCTAGVDETTIKNWKSIMRRAESRGSTNRVITLFLKRGAELKDSEYKRAAIVNFNIYNELKEGKLNLYGVKIRKNDLNIYTKTLETIFDNIADVDEYSVGSNSGIAPYFDAVVKAYAGLIKMINKTTWLLRKPIKTVKGYDLYVKDEFSELFEELSVYRDIIPALPYNEGDRNNKRKTQQVAETTQPQQQVVQPQPVANNGYMTNNLQHAPVAVQPPPVPQQPVQQQPQTAHVSQTMPSIEEQLYGPATYPVVNPYQQYPAYAQPYGGWNTQPMSPMGYPQPMQQPQQTGKRTYGSWNDPGFTGFVMPVYR